MTAKNRQREHHRKDSDQDRKTTPDPEGRVRGDGVKGMRLVRKSVNSQSHQRGKHHTILDCGDKRPESPGTQRVIWAGVDRQV